MKAGEYAVSGLSLEIQDPAHRAIIFSDWLVQVNPGHLALGEVDRAEVGDPALLGAVHPDLLADHQHVRVLVEDHLGGALPPQPCLRHSPPLQLGRVNILGLPASRGSSSLRDTEV